jgi:hypothetical protein
VKQPPPFVGAHGLPFLALECLLSSGYSFLNVGRCAFGNLDQHLVGRGIENGKCLAVAGRDKLA